jgi:hypothetical protein
MLSIVMQIRKTEAAPKRNQLMGACLANAGPHLEPGGRIGGRCAIEAYYHI